MGVFLDAGSADETPEQLGTSKVLENLAFGSSYSRSQVQISKYVLSAVVVGCGSH